MNGLPFRQVHLDFHTSELIPNIGVQFNKEQFQQALKLGHVNSITLFSKCHHGYSYHSTEVGKIHPNLKFDLLDAQIEACKEIGVKTPVYLSAGLDERVALMHPEWLARRSDESTMGSRDFISRAGYHVLCYNTPYFDLLLAQTKEVMEKYNPEAVFFDISSVRPCYCSRCRADIKARGKDIRDYNAVLEQAELVYKKYATELEKVVHEHNPNAAIFHNAGHITRGRRDLVNHNTHLELESLPTGGWGYDHFPMSASYAMTLGKEYLGMTGKFHTSWGEFGGYKHPNALRYETALSLAFGAKCSVGDQLHPYGHMDMATYKLIGTAYKEVEEKEAWRYKAENLADIAVLSQEAVNTRNSNLTVKHFGDIGANRILLEGKYLYHFVDAFENFSKYKVIILPDDIRLDASLQEKLEEYLKNGGKILSTGLSGLKLDKDEFAIDLGVRFKQQSSYTPNYVKVLFETTNAGGTFVMYSEGYDIELTKGKVVGYKENPFFNRDIDSFCSHQHTPANTINEGTGIVLTDNTAYVSWKVFSDYAKIGSLHIKEIVTYLLDYLLGENKTIFAELPDRAVITMTEQKEEKRYINHILFAHTTKRGHFTQNENIGGDIEVIESITPLYDIDIKFKIDKAVKKIYLAPGLEEIEFTQQENVISYTVPKVECHQMIVIEY